MQFSADFTSHRIRLIAYDEEMQSLFVQWVTSPSVLRIEAVPEARYRAFLRAPSKSQFLEQQLIPAYCHRILSREELLAFEDQLAAEMGRAARMRLLGRVVGRSA